MQLWEGPARRRRATRRDRPSLHRLLSMRDQAKYVRDRHNWRAGTAQSESNKFEMTARISRIPIAKKHVALAMAAAPVSPKAGTSLASAAR